MSNTRLTQRQIDALKPRKKTSDLRDTELKGFGVRVRSSGIKRYLVQSQHEGTRTWRIIGNAAGITDVQGHAGTGKTTMLKTAASLLGGAGSWDWRPRRRQCLRPPT